MNMVLADIQSLNPSAGGVAADAGSINSGSTDGQFPDILTKQLSRHVELPPQVEYPQVTDLKELLSSGGFPDEASEVPFDMSEKLPAWLQQPALEPNMETNTAEQAPTTTLKPAEELGAEHVENTLPVVGHTLPVAGNTLPPEHGSVGKPLPAIAQAASISDTAEFKHATKQLPVSVRETIYAGSEKADGLKLSELPITSKGSSLPGAEPGFPQKTDLQNEMFNARGGELQNIQTNLNNIAEQSSGQYRLHNHTGVLPSQTTQPNTAMLPTSLETLSVSSSRDSATWGNGIGERVHWMINQKLNTATIRLDPPMLGRLEVSIQVNDDITSVTINTQHAQTRDLIDNASFRLRDYLQESGYQNVNVDVSHEQEQGQHASQRTSDDSDHQSAEAVSKQDAEVGDEEHIVEFVSSDSIVDYFA